MSEGKKKSDKKRSTFTFYYLLSNIFTWRERPTMEYDNFRPTIKRVS